MLISTIGPTSTDGHTVLLMQDVSASKTGAQVVDAIRVVTIEFGVLFRDYLHGQVLELEG